MEKEWCTYSFQGKTLPENVGKIVGDYGKSVDILYSEGQMYPAELWDIRFIMRFNTLEEAIEYFLKNKPSYDTRIDHEISDERHLERIKYSFSSYFK